MSDDNEPTPPPRATRPARPAGPTPRAAPPAAPTQPTPPAPATVAATPSSGRPVRPAAPTLSARRDSTFIEIPQGLSLADPGLSGIPSLTRTPAVTSSAAANALAEQQRLRAAALRQTLLPSCLVLGITLPVLAAGWFALDRFSVVRDNPLGLSLPIALALVGVLFLSASALLWTQSQRAAGKASH